MSAKNRLTSKWGHLLDRARNIRDLRGAWSFLKWLVAETWWWAAIKRREAWWHFQSLMRSRWLRARAPRMVGTSGEAAPAFDLRAYNPIGWRADTGREGAALGPVEKLPLGVEAHRVIPRSNLHRLRHVHHLEDVAAFHSDPVTRAGELVRLAAAGVVTRLADDDEQLRPLLGDELYRLMTADMKGMDAGERELLSIKMRRAALREHSSWARARRLGTEGLPLVSILLPTKRPGFLPYALGNVARQTYPRLELILMLHGEGFADGEQGVAELPHPAKVLWAPASEPLGAVLNATVEASSGTLLTRMDDDDVYGAEHVWDLVLARQYSGAHLVGKCPEFVYLAASDQTVCRRHRGNERFTTGDLAGGTLLISRQDLARAGGWRRVPRSIDAMLDQDVGRTGGRTYGLYGAGFMLVRHGHRHTWKVSDDYFLVRADRVSAGWNPALAGIDDLNLPPPTHRAPLQ